MLRFQRKEGLFDPFIAGIASVNFQLRHSPPPSFFQLELIDACVHYIESLQRQLTECDDGRDSFGDEKENDDNGNAIGNANANCGGRRRSHSQEGLGGPPPSRASKRRMSTSLASSSTTSSSSSSSSSSRTSSLQRT